MSSSGVPPLSPPSFGAPEAAASSSAALLPDAHALVIGISRYRQVPPLPRTWDAEDVAAALVDPQLCAYPPAQVRTVLEEEATHARLIDELGALARRTTAASTVLVYFSGHGGALPAPASECFLMPVDACADSQDALEASTISGAELSGLLRQIPAARLTVILDCCRASGLAEPQEPLAQPATPATSAVVAEAPWSAGALAALARGRGRVVMAASRRDGYSYVLPGRRNGLFTEVLLEGLRGAAPGIGGVIRVCDLYHYLQQQVVQRHRAQRPVFKAELEENYPLALHRGGAAPPWTLPPAPDALPYDAFVSYCQRDPQDEAWVHQVLVPGLEALGARLCLEHRDLRLGRNRIKELERAVTSSRYTLCVLTPSYLAGAFETLCAELAQFHGVESGSTRFLPLLRRPCRPPMAARMLQLLDVSADGEAPLRATLARLAVALREPAGER